MNFEWDEAKRLINLRKHGFDFIDTEIVFARDIVTIEDNRAEYDEVRFITVGMLHSWVVIIVHTETEDTIRIISMRKATKYEERIYLQQIGY